MSVLGLGLYEAQAVLSLIKQGYTVKMVNESAERFNQKYRVYQETSAGNKMVVLDSKGNLIAVQG